MLTVENLWSETFRVFQELSSNTQSILDQLMQINALMHLTKYFKPINAFIIFNQ